jgi:hypothetical protein
VLRVASVAQCVDPLHTQELAEALRVVLLHGLLARAQPDRDGRPRLVVVPPGALLQKVVDGPLGQSSIWFDLAQVTQHIYYMQGSQVVV